MTVKRRTFEALKHPAGSEERIALNKDPLTSEHSPAFEWLSIPERGEPVKFKTKEGAEGHEAWRAPKDARKK